MNVQTVIACIIIIAAFLLYRKFRKPVEDQQYYDAAELIEAIRALSALADQLENADRMLEDLSACNPRELLRGFRAQWCGIDGKQRQIDFLADGRNRVTAGLLTAAEEQRDELNDEIIAAIRALAAALDAGAAPALEVYAVGETVDETESGELARWCRS